MSRSTSYIGPITFEGLEDLEEDLLSEDPAPLEVPPPVSEDGDQDPSVSGIMASYAAVGGPLLEPDPLPPETAFDDETEVGGQAGEPTQDIEYIPEATAEFASEDDTASQPAMPGLTTSDLVVASESPRPQPGTVASEDSRPVDRSTVTRAVATAEARRLEIAPRVEVEDVPEAPVRGPWVIVAVLTLVGVLVLAGIIFGAR